VRWLPDRTVAHLRRVAEWPDLADTKYRLLEELGRGGMGTVYLAEDTVLGRKVALKVISTGAADAETADRMLREARIIARLEHPGIVPVHDAGALPDGRIFYAMKRVEGERLDAFAARAPLPDRLRSFQRICEAVAFAHAHGVLHRDLKPDNVMVGSFGEVLVMDWGIAKLLDAAAERTAGGGTDAGASQTAAGTVVGTLSYMAPEQAEPGSDGVSPQTDVYALGAVLYYLLARRPPFEGAAAERRARGEAALPPTSLRRLEPSIPRPLEAIVTKAMAADPAGRYASAEELAAEVGRFLGGEPVRAYREPPWERAARIFARYRTPILLVAAYLVMRTLVILFGRG
jgi:eukaryotic-like serine/threonine-protein kinase